MNQAPQYTIKSNGQAQGYLESLDAASELIVEQLKGIPASKETTLTVENEDGYLLACVSNRQIRFAMAMQWWREFGGGPSVDIKMFDATWVVLNMPLNDLHQVVDKNPASEAIGRRFKDWDGECEVSIEQPIRDFFGVSSINEITPEALAFALNWFKSQPESEKLVTLTVHVKVRVTPDACLTKFVDDLDFTVTSRTDGVSVMDTEIVSSF